MERIDDAYTKFVGWLESFQDKENWIKIMTMILFGLAVGGLVFGILKIFSSIIWILAILSGCAFALFTWTKMRKSDKVIVENEESEN